MTFPLLTSSIISTRFCNSAVDMRDPTLISTIHDSVATTSSATNGPRTCRPAAELTLRRLSRTYPRHDAGQRASHGLLGNPCHDWRWSWDEATTGSIWATCIWWRSQAMHSPPACS